jgi:hypothetical protein
MGGNVTALNALTGHKTRAEKIDLQLIGRCNFINTFNLLFKTINKEFYSKYGKPIWKDETILDDGYAFNGSTSFIMNQSYTDPEILKYKTSCGDVDITVPDDLKAELWEYLYSIQGKEIIPGCTYMGSNKPSIQSIGEQINSVFCIEFPSGSMVCAQVDFEFLEYKNNKPTDWAKFSHSSSFTDAKVGIKAVHHKYLIRALVGGASVRNDIVICTPSSTADNFTISKSKIHAVPRMLKFSVGRGIREAYAPLKDFDGEYLLHDGKKVYREIPSKTSTYETDIDKIFEMTFGQISTDARLRWFNSFVGVLELMHQHLTAEQIEETHKRYLELLWAPDGRLRAQGLEAGNPMLDLEVKLAGYKYLVKYLKVMDCSADMIKEYYKKYPEILI